MRPGARAEFGGVLKRWRVEAGLEQKQAASKITDVLARVGSTKERCHANELSTYENATRKPSAALLCAIAEVYQKDVYAVLCTAFMAEHLEYLPATLHNSDLLWQYLASGVEILSEQRGDKDWATHRLRSIISFSKTFPLLDVTGAQAWERSLKHQDSPLECFWVASLDFVDDESFFEVVRDNVRAGAIYVYFIRERYVRPDGKFERFRSRLVGELGESSRQLVRCVPFRSSEELILALDFVVANPHREDCQGFQTIWKGDEFYNLKLPNSVVRQRVRALENYLTRRTWNPVIREHLLPLDGDTSVHIPD